MSDLFVSSEQMQNAVNYTRYTYDQFKEFIKGECLEVGCGVGSFSSLIAKHPLLNKLVSIDISKASVEYCLQKHSNPKITFLHENVMNHEGNYDFIVCMNVMEHIRDDAEFFRKLVSLLTPGGILFLLVPAHKSMYSSFDSAAGHYRRYTKRSLNAKTDSIETDNLTQYYFNPIGIIGYFIVYKIFAKKPVTNPESEISFFDRVIVPVSKFIFPRGFIFGISLISIYRKN